MSTQAATIDESWTHIEKRSTPMSDVFKDRVMTVWDKLPPGAAMSAQELLRRTPATNEVKFITRVMNRMLEAGEVEFKLDPDNQSVMLYVKLPQPKQVVGRKMLAIQIDRIVRALPKNAHVNNKGLLRLVNRGCNDENMMAAELILQELLKEGYLTDYKKPGRWHEYIVAKDPELPPTAEEEPIPEISQDIIEEIVPSEAEEIEEEVEPVIEPISTEPEEQAEPEHIKETSLEELVGVSDEDILQHPFSDEQIGRAILHVYDSLQRENAQLKETIERMHSEAVEQIAGHVQELTDELNKTKESLRLKEGEYEILEELLRKHEETLSERADKIAELEADLMKKTFRLEELEAGLKKQKEQVKKQALHKIGDYLKDK